MWFLSLLLIFINFAVLHASPDVFAREPGPSGERASPTQDGTVILCPMNPGNPEQVTQTEIELQQLCGAENVETVQTEDGNTSWILTLSENESLEAMQAIQGLNIDESANHAMDEFFSHLENVMAFLSPQIHPRLGAYFQQIFITISKMTQLRSSYCRGQRTS